MHRRRPPLADVALAVALAILACVEAVASGSGTRSVLLAAALPLPLAWRRIVPSAAVLGVLAFVAADALSGGEGLELVSSTVAIVLAVYSLGAHASLEEGLLTLGACLGVAWLSVSAADDSSASDYAFATIVTLAPWAVGRIAGGRLAVAEAERERADRAAAEERARIARELHDVVAHAVGVIVVQAGAAEQVLDTDPTAARQALADIRRTGKEALVDLRRMLGLLRESDVRTDVAPQPGLEDLGRLGDVDLVHDDHGVGRHPLRHPAVAASQRLGGVEHQHHDVDVADGRLGGHVEPLAQGGAGLVDAGRVHEHGLGVRPVEHPLDPVARRLGLVRDDGDLVPEDAVEERRLSHVGPPDEAHEP